MVSLSDTETVIRSLRLSLSHIFLALRYWQRLGVLPVFFIFLLLFVVGIALLSIPAASETSISFSERLTTVFSAVTTAGFSPLPISASWSFFGEGILAVLVLFGGFFYMVTASFLLWMLGQKFGFRDPSMKRLYIGTPSLAEKLSFVRTIFLIVLGLQFLGAVFLVFAFLIDGFSISTALWWGPFHSITSFNNAGFALHPDEFTFFRGSPIVLATSGFLAFCGAIGPIPLSFLLYRRKNKKIPMDGKVIFLGFLIVLFFGMAMFLITEWTNPETLAVMDSWKRPFIAFFESSMRSTGYSVFDIESLRLETQLVHTALMAIGGAAGGAAGGLKIGLIFILAISIFSTLRGYSEMKFRRTIFPEHLMRQALVLLFAFIGFIGVLTGLLLLFGEYSMFDALFEVISAVSLAGFSSEGFISNKDSNVILSIAMLIGRFFPIMVVIEMTRPRVRPNFHRPEDNVLFG